MATFNTAAQDTASDLVAGTYATASLIFYAGATVLVTHTLTGFSVSASGVKTANAIADATVVASGTATSAKLVAGGNEVTLTVGVAGSGAQIIMANTTLVEGGTSTINSLTATMPAS